MQLEKAAIPNPCHMLTSFNPSHFELSGRKSRLVNPKELTSGLPDPSPLLKFSADLPIYETHASLDLVFTHDGANVVLESRGSVGLHKLNLHDLIVLFACRIYDLLELGQLGPRSLNSGGELGIIHVPRQLLPGVVRETFGDFLSRGFHFY